MTVFFRSIFLQICHMILNSIAHHRIVLDEAYQDSRKQQWGKNLSPTDRAVEDLIKHNSHSFFLHNDVMTWWVFSPMSASSQNLLDRIAVYGVGRNINTDPTTEAYHWSWSITVQSFCNCFLFVCLLVPKNKATLSLWHRKQRNWSFPFLQHGLFLDQTVCVIPTREVSQTKYHNMITSTARCVQMQTTAQQLHPRCNAVKTSANLHTFASPCCKVLSLSVEFANETRSHATWLRGIQTPNGPRPVGPEQGQHWHAQHLPPVQEPGPFVCLVSVEFWVKIEDLEDT